MLSTGETVKALGITGHDSAPPRASGEISAIALTGAGAFRSQRSRVNGPQDPVGLAQEWLAEGVQDLPPMLSTAKVAELLDMKIDAVCESARSGQLPCTRIGRRARFPTAAITAVLVAGGSFDGGAPP